MIKLNDVIELDNKSYIVKSFDHQGRIAILSRNISRSITHNVRISRYFLETNKGPFKTNEIFAHERRILLSLLKDANIPAILERSKNCKLFYEGEQSPFFFNFVNSFLQHFFFLNHGPNRRSA